MGNLYLNVLPIELQPSTDDAIIARLDRESPLENKIRATPDVERDIHIYSTGRYTYIWARPGRTIPAALGLENSGKISVADVPSTVVAYAARESSVDRLASFGYRRVSALHVQIARLYRKQKNLVQEALAQDFGPEVGLYPCVELQGIPLDGRGLRGPRTATFPHQHEPAQVHHVRPGKVVERGPLSPGPVALVLDISLISRCGVSLQDVAASGVSLEGLRVVWRHADQCSCGPDKASGNAGRIAAAIVGNQTAVAADGRSLVAPTDCLELQPSRQVLEQYLVSVAGVSAAQLTASLDAAVATFLEPRNQWGYLKQFRVSLDSLEVFTTKAEVRPPVSAVPPSSPSQQLGPVLLPPLEAPELNFRHGRPLTAPGAAQGLRRYGPYDKDSVDRLDPISAIALCPEPLRADGQRLVRALSDRVGNFPGMEQRYSLSSFAPRLETFSEDSVGGYRAAAAEVARSQPDVVFLITRYADRFSPRANPYFAAKAILASVGIPSQAVTVETLRQSDQKLQWSVDSISLQTYAKIGNIPYVLYDPGGRRELVLGVGRSDINDPEKGFQRRLFGAAAAFRQDGDFLFAGSTAPVTDWDMYEEGLTDLLSDFIKRYEFEQGAELERLTLHVFKKTGPKEPGPRRSLDSLRFVRFHPCSGAAVNIASAPVKGRRIVNKDPDISHN